MPVLFLRRSESDGYTASAGPGLQWQKALQRHGRIVDLTMGGEPGLAGWALSALTNVLIRKGLGRFDAEEKVCDHTGREE